MNIGIPNGTPLNTVLTGDDLVPVYDQSTGTEGYANLSVAMQQAFTGAEGGGTANGVLYLNASKQVSSGSALTYNGSTLGINFPASSNYKFYVSRGGTTGEVAAFTDGLAQTLTVDTTASSVLLNSANGGALVFGVSGEQMRLTSTGLGIGTSSPSARSHTSESNPTRGVIAKFNNSATSAQTGCQIQITQAGIADWAIGQPAGTNAFAFWSDRDKFSSDGTERLRIDNSGNLLVGTTTNNLGKISVQSSSTKDGISVESNTTSTTGQINFRNPNGYVGAISSSGTSTAYTTSSDYRLKDNQSPLTNSGAFIDALKPKTWNWKTDGSKGVGFIAHEVQEVSPTSVVGEKDAMRIEQYEVSPAVPATYDEQGNELTPAVEAVMGEREVPAYQAMEYGSAEFIANIVAELQSLRKRVAVLEAR